MLRIYLLIVVLFSSTGAVAQMFQPGVAYLGNEGATVVTTGDFNADGLQDAAVGTSYMIDEIEFWVQNTNKQLVRLENFATDRRIESIDTGDFNGDNIDDIVFGTTDYIGILITEPNLTHRLIKIPANESRIVKVADFNRDGRDDIVSADQGSNLAEVRLQTNTGLVLKSTLNIKHNGYDEIEVSDLDGNGFPDIVIMSGQGLTPTLGIAYQTTAGFNPTVYYNLGGTPWTLTSGMAIGDLNGDGRKDIALSMGGNSPTSRLVVMYQDSQGLFPQAISITSYDIPEPVELADVNLDGHLDVVVAHGGWDAVGVYLQKNNGTLSAETIYPNRSMNILNPQGLVVDDLNSDGVPDIATANFIEGLVVLYHSPVPAPSVDIKANGLDGWSRLDPATPLSLTVKVTPTIAIGKPANYYLVYQNNEGAWWLNSSNQWVKSQKPIIFYSGSAKILSKTLVKDAPKYGNYILMVVVDDRFLWDYVSVTQ